MADRNIGASYIDYDRPSEEAPMSSRVWIHNQDLTTREIDVAKAALRFYRAAHAAPVRDEYDGTPKYTGKTVLEVVDGAIKDKARRTVVMHLVVMLAKEQGLHVGTGRRKRKRRKRETGAGDE